MKLKVNQTVKVLPFGEYGGSNGFIYKLDRFARTYSISTGDGRFFEFSEDELGEKFELI